MRLFTTLTIILLATVLVAKSTFAIAVYESQLSSNAVNVQISDEEARAVVDNPAYARSLAVDVTREMLLLAGIPSSITGKVAAAGVAQVLISKYNSDILLLSNRHKQNFTMKYNVNLEGVRSAWDSDLLNKYGDELMPGGPVLKAALSIINMLVNASLR